MKKTSFILVATLILAAMLMLAACDNAHTHTAGDAVKENNIQATCATPGSYDEVVYCSGCKAEMSRDKKTVDTTDVHVNVATFTEKESSCTEVVVCDEIKRCVDCNAELERRTVQLPINHSCDDNGVCSACNRKIANGLLFTSNGDGTCNVAGIGNCTDTEIIIPYFSPEGDRVTGIGDRAFAEYTELKSLIIPDGVVSIGSFAFDGCLDIENISIPNSIAVLEPDAFYNFHVWNYYKYKHGEYLGNDKNNYLILLDAFIGNSKYFEVHPDTRFIDDGAIADCEELETVKLSDNIVGIGCGAFLYCPKLKNVTIPEKVTKIGSNTFKGCTSLESVTLPDGITEIGASAFFGCEKLRNLRVPSNVTSVGADAFEGCESIAYYSYGNCSYLGDEKNPYHILVKAKNNNIRSCEINPNTLIVCDEALLDCTYIKSVDIPQNVISIGKSAFSYCTALETISFAQNSRLEKIGHSAFYHCESLKAANLPDSVKAVGYSLFCGCKSLTSVHIPKNITVISDNMFYGCNSLVSCELPNGVTKIGKHAFDECFNLKNIIIPDSVTTIGQEAFRYCKSFIDITIPNGVTSIGMHLFTGCGSLESVTLPDSMTDIGAGAFFYCESLKLINYRGTEEQWKALTNGYGWDESTCSYTVVYNYTGE